MDDSAPRNRPSQATPNHRASLIHPNQVARLPQLSPQRRQLYAGLVRRCWQALDSLPPGEQKYNEAYQTLVRTSQTLMLGLKNYHRAAKQRQRQQRADVTGPQRSQQLQKSRVQFNQLMPEIQQKVNEHIFFYPPSVMEEMKKAEDWLSEAKARLGQALQRLQVAETRKEEFQRQAQQRLAAGSPLSPQMMDIFNTKLAQSDRAIAESQTFIEKFRAQQNEFRNAQPSQQYTRSLPSVTVAKIHPLLFFNLPPEIRNMIYQQVLLAGKPLNLHAFGLLATDEENRPDTAIMATYKQVLAEARPVFYSINSFVIEERVVLSHHLKATPQPLRRLKLHAIKHVVLDGCAMLNITRIAELKRLRSLETLTVFELWFHWQLPGWHDQYHGVNFRRWSPLR